jgi:alkylation response protein AidB-like acyl-CoA dehydrogenase
MNFELKPHTAAGERFVALAEAHAADFASRADQHDRDGSFPFENIAAMQRSGVLAAWIPEQFGGLGVEAVHDYVLGINRLGRGDGSTALLANMHNFRTWSLVRAWQAAASAGDAGRAEKSAQLLRQVGAGQLLICALASESGTDLLHPLVEAKHVPGGWLLNGRKIFGTLSPAASVLGVVCRIQDTPEHVRQGLASVPAGTAGVDIANNWDALGMRSSGSHDVVFTDCFVPEEAVVETGPWGDFTERFLAANGVAMVGLSAAFLGIAEAAHNTILAMLTAQRRGPHGRRLAERPAVQHLMGEIEIDLAAARAMLERTTQTLDAVFGQPTVTSIPLDTLHHLMKDIQCTKWLVTRRAIDIVDRALTASGGAGYLTQSPLSRLYRDVRAGPFMQPFSPNEAFEYIGKVALGLDPRLEA